EGADDTDHPPASRGTGGPFGDEGPPAGDALDQSIICESSHNRPRRGFADLILLAKLLLSRKGRANSMPAGHYVIPQFCQNAGNLRARFASESSFSHGDPSWNSICRVYYRKFIVFCKAEKRGTCQKDPQLSIFEA